MTQALCQPLALRSPRPWAGCRPGLSLLSLNRGHNEGTSLRFGEVPVSRVSMAPRGGLTWEDVLFLLSRLSQRLVNHTRTRVGGPAVQSQKSSKPQSEVHTRALAPPRGTRSAGPPARAPSAPGVGASAPFRGQRSTTNAVYGGIARAFQGGVRWSALSRLCQTQVQPLCFCQQPLATAPVQDSLTWPAPLRALKGPSRAEGKG